MRDEMRTTRVLGLTAVLLAAFSSTSFAVDGQIAITQAKALAGGVTPGDAPGFPVMISQPGSYVLSSNLLVPNADTTAIVIAASHVTLDLNGFAILGPTDCSGGLDPCAGEGTGFGITTGQFVDGPQFNVTIRNGTVQGMGSAGISLVGDSLLVEYMHVRSNGGAGIVISASADGGSSIVQHSTVQRNSSYGIAVSRGAVRNNVADVNGAFGITLGYGSASQNVLIRNFQGLAVGINAGAFGNTMFDNSSGNFFGGANLGQNFCTGVGGTC